MTKSCKNCNKLNKYNQCTVIEDFMQVIVNVIGDDYETLAYNPKEIHSVTVKDKALGSFCCNQYSELKNKEDKTIGN